MRFLFWLLLILNLGVLLYFGLSELSNDDAVSNAQADIAPEKMELLATDQLAEQPQRKPSRASKQAARPERKQAACYEWGNFTQNELVNATTLVNAFFIDSKVLKEGESDAVRYWVYKPPLASAAKARAKAREIKALGINEFFIVQEPKMRNAISFGVFKIEAGADRLMKELRQKGVNRLVKAVRNKGAGSASLQLNGVTPTLLKQLKKNLPDFPSTEIKSVACK